MKLLSLSLCIAALNLTRESSAALMIKQGRIVTSPPVDIQEISVVGIATVELGGSNASRPSYYFDCITNRNNGSGIWWSRLTTTNPFDVVSIPDGTHGKRLDVGAIDYPDLDIYTCSDRYSDDIAAINITAFNPAIMAAMDTVGVIQGLTVQLEVYVSGYPVPTSPNITWYRPNGTEILDSDAGVVFQGSNRRLILSNVQPQQAGRYECEVILSLTPYRGNTTAIQLNVYVASTIVTQPMESMDVLEWTEVILNCSASGSPIPLIRWEREGNTQLPIGTEISSSMSGNIMNSQLTFTMIRYEDRGRYRCVADNVETVQATSQYTDISVFPALILVDEQMQPVNDLYFVEDKSSVRLECHGTGSLQWTSSTDLEIPLATSGNVYQSYDLTRDALSLVIQNFTSITTATYTCMTNLTDARNNSITVSVLVTSSNPAVIIQSQEQYVLAGSSTTLEARVFASPAESAVMQWYHEGRQIDVANEAQYTATSSGDIHRLTVDSVSENEIGEYTIVVILGGLNVTDGIMLKFPVPPSATITPSLISVNEGESVTIICVAEGSGALTVTWTMSDGSPPPVGVQENGNTLFIASATSAHPGTYVCSVMNLAGTSQDEVILTVFYGLPPTRIIISTTTSIVSKTEEIIPSTTVSKAEEIIPSTTAGEGEEVISSTTVGKGEEIISSTTVSKGEEASPAAFGTTEIAVILGVFVCILAVSLVLLVVAVCVYYWKNKVKRRGNNKENDCTYNELQRIGLQNIDMPKESRKEGDQIQDHELPHEKVRTHYDKVHTYEDVPVHETAVYEKVQTYEKAETYEKVPVFEWPQVYEATQTNEMAQTYETLPQTACELQLQRNVMVFGTDV